MVPLWRRSSTLLQIASVGALPVTSALALIAPTYLRLRGGPRLACYILALVLSLASGPSIILELAGLIRNGRFSRMAATAVLLASGLGLYLLDDRTALTPTWQKTARIAVLTLFGGGALVMMSAFHHIIEDSEWPRRKSTVDLALRRAARTMIVMTVALVAVGTLLIGSVLLVRGN